MLVETSSSSISSSSHHSSGCNRSHRSDRCPHSCDHFGVTLKSIWDHLVMNLVSRWSRIRSRLDPFGSSWRA